MSNELEQIRALRARYGAGQITLAEYHRQYRAIDGRTGQPCANCGAVPAPVTRRDGTSWCASCVLAERRLIENMAIERRAGCWMWLGLAALAVVALAMVVGGGLLVIGLL